MDLMEIIAIIIGYIIITSIVLLIVNKFGFSIVDPGITYDKLERMDKLNTADAILGLAILSVILDLVFLPYTFCYWMYRLIRELIKKENK